MQRRTILIPLAVVALVVAIFVAFPPSPVMHVDGLFPVCVTGKLVAPVDAMPIAGAFVMTAPSRLAGAARLADGFYRERIDGWLAYNDAEVAEGRDAPEPGWAPWLSSGARTQEDGTFSIVQALPWFYDKAGWLQSRPSRPPPRYYVEVLAIEIEGRDPLILDVPIGTWTAHDGEDGLWATWDLGVVEVSGRP